MSAPGRRSNVSKIPDVVPCAPAGVRDRMRAGVVHRVLRVCNRKNIETSKPGGADRYFRRAMRCRWMRDAA